MPDILMDGEFYTHRIGRSPPDPRFLLRIDKEFQADDIMYAVKNPRYPY